MSEALTRELVEAPEYVQFYMRLSPGALDVLLYNPHEENSLIHREFPLPASHSERLSALETAIYDNPLLLADFAKIRISVATPLMSVVPDEAIKALEEENAETAELFRTLHPDAPQRLDILSNRLTPYGATLLTAIPRDEARFMRRTFNNAHISGALAPWTAYCRGTMPRGNTVRAFVNIRPASLDLLIISSENLYLLNRFNWRNINDAAYYIIAATEPDVAPVSEIFIAGDREAREQLMPLLRRFRPYVMPTIFPSEMYRAGSQSLNAPFDLVIQPLCE